MARHGLILGVLNRQSLLAWRRKRSGAPLWQEARFFSPAELVRLVQQAAAASLSPAIDEALQIFQRGLSVEPGAMSTLGSVAERVARHSPCPVLLVRQEPETANEA